MSSQKDFQSKKGWSVRVVNVVCAANKNIASATEALSYQANTCQIGTDKNDEESLFNRSYPKMISSNIIDNIIKLSNTH